MTLLVNKNSGNAGPTVKNYTLLSGDSINIPATITNAQYMKGSIFIKDSTDGLFFNYNITNSTTLTSNVYGMIGKEFNVSISDFVSGSMIGFTLVNHEIFTLTIDLIQEL